MSEANIFDPAIYVASRASNPERVAMWQKLREEGWPIVSTWIDKSGDGDIGDFMEFWDICERQIRASAGVILYAETDDFPLKGAIFECGIAIGMGKPVVVVLPGVKLEGRTARPIGSWIQHRLVSIQPSLEAARLHLLGLHDQLS